VYEILSLQSVSAQSIRSVFPELIDNQRVAFVYFFFKCFENFGFSILVLTFN
jgi:hypothetical protein